MNFDNRILWDFGIKIKKGRTCPLDCNDIFLKLWYDYVVVAIRVNVKMVSTRVGVFHASRCCSIMIA